MNSQKSLSVFPRLISRSCVRQKAAPKKLVDKKLNLGETVVVPVEQDTHKLATYVCGTNLLSEGGEDIKLKPDSEYPDWLWKIISIVGYWGVLSHKEAYSPEYNFLTPPLPLKELDPNTKNYWNRVRRLREKEVKFLNSLQKSKSVHK